MPISSSVFRGVILRFPVRFLFNLASLTIARPRNLMSNPPGILTPSLQTKGRTAFDPSVTLARRLGHPSVTLGCPKGHPNPIPVISCSGNSGMESVLVRVAHVTDIIVIESHFKSLVTCPHQHRAGKLSPLLYFAIYSPEKQAQGPVALLD